MLVRKKERKWVRKVNDLKYVYGICYTYTAFDEVSKTNMLYFTFIQMKKNKHENLLLYPFN